MRIAVIGTGLIGALHARFFNRNPACDLVGDGGSVIIEGAPLGMRVVNQTRYSKPVMTHWPMGHDGVGGALARSLDIFVNRSRARLPLLVGLVAARRAEAVVVALKHSITQERIVRLDEFAQRAA